MDLCTLVYLRGLSRMEREPRGDLRTRGGEEDGKGWELGVGSWQRRLPPVCVARPPTKGKACLSRLPFPPQSIWHMREAGGPASPTQQIPYPRSSPLGPGYRGSQLLF